MRWHDLFADLEGQAEAWEQADLDAEVADRTRAEQATISLGDRLAAACGQRVSMRVAGAGQVQGDLVAVGADWLLLGDGEVERLVLAAAVQAVRDLDRRAETPQSRSPVMARLGVGGPMRAIARDRSTVRITLRDGSEVTGTLERVGGDYLDLLVHEVGEPARPGGRERLTLAFGGIAVVQTTASGWGA